MIALCVAEIHVVQEIPKLSGDAGFRNTRCHLIDCMKGDVRQLRSAHVRTFPKLCSLLAA